MPPLFIDDDNIESDISSLTTALSGQTPTDPFRPTYGTIEALQAQQSDTEYNLILASIPAENKIVIRGVTYVYTEPYKLRKSRRAAWYWVDHGVELLRATKGKAN